MVLWLSPNPRSHSYSKTPTEAASCKLLHLSYQLRPFVTSAVSSAPTTSGLLNKQLIISFSRDAPLHLSCQIKSQKPPPARTIRTAELMFGFEVAIIRSTDDLYRSRD
ncbi:hypothetical protein J6590_027860 [Homalodisca vitripennis]|nr:hypothetical protein J6590_027860 [Homalodisca vitripennis]